MMGNLYYEITIVNTLNTIVIPERALASGTFLGRLLNRSKHVIKCLPFWIQYSIVFISLTTFIIIYLVLFI